MRCMAEVGRYLLLIIPAEGVIGVVNVVLAGEHVDAFLPQFVATWNIETVGNPGSTEYNAALAILQRIDADIVYVNGITDPVDSLNVETLGLSAGYIIVDVAVPLTAYSTAILTKIPYGNIQVHTSVSISGDPAANDLSEVIIEIGYLIHDCDRDVVILGTLTVEPGMGDDSEFLRAVGSKRISSVRDDIENGMCATCTGTVDPIVIVIGGMNEEIDTVPSPRIPSPRFPPVWRPPSVWETTWPPCSRSRVLKTILLCRF